MGSTIQYRYIKLAHLGRLDLIQDFGDVSSEKSKFEISASMTAIKNTAPSYVLAISAVIPTLLIGGIDNLTSLSIVIYYSAILVFSVTTNKSGASKKLPLFLFLSISLYAFSALLIVSKLYIISPIIKTYPWSLISGKAHYFSDQSRPLLELIRLAGLASAFLASYVITRSRKNSKLVFELVMKLGVIYSLWSICSFALSPHSIMGFFDKGNLFPGRLTASFLSANTAGTFFAIMFILCIGQLSSVVGEQSKKIRDRYFVDRIIASITFPVVGIATSGIALLLTGSRTAAVVAVACSILVALAAALARELSLKLISIVVVSSLILGLTVIIAGGGRSVSDRFVELGNDASVRSSIYQSHITALRTHAVGEFGPGTFELVNRSIMSQKNYLNIWNVRAMHNVYLQWIEGAGIASSLLTFCSIISICFFIFVSALFKGCRSTRDWTIIGISIAICLHSFTDFALENMSISGLWAIFLGIGCAEFEGNHSLISMK